jgi:hypothetical protein
MDVNTSTVADAEAMHWVVLDVNIMNRALPKHFAELNEVVWSASSVSSQGSYIAHAPLDSLGHAPIRSKTVPPSFAVAIKNGPFCGSNFDIRSSHLDERIIRVEILPEGGTTERDF